MPSSSSSTSPDLDGLSGLFSLIGIIPARARYIGEAVVSSTLSSITIGLSCGMIGAVFLPIGPTIPVLFGSWIGHTFGLWHYYRSSKNLALQYAKKYPTILGHAMYTEFNVIVPSEVILMSSKSMNDKNDDIDELRPANKKMDILSTASTPALDQWIQNKGLKMMGFAIMAAQSCWPDVQEIQRQQRDRLIETQGQQHQDNE